MVGYAYEGRLELRWSSVEQTTDYIYAKPELCNQMDHAFFHLWKTTEV